MKKLIILCAIVLTALLLIASVAGCQQKSPPSSSTGNIRVTATINGLEKADEATLTISHEGSAASEEFFFKRDVISDGKKAITVDIAANLEDGFYQLLLEASEKYFRDPKGYFFMVSQSQIVNPTGMKVIFNLLPQPEGLVAEAYISLSALPKVGGAPPPPFQSSLIPEEAHYLPGEKVEVTLSIANTSGDNMTISHYPPEVQVSPWLDREQVLSSRPGGTQPLEVRAGETVTQDFAWDQKDSQGQQASPGWYAVSFRDMNITQGDRGTMSHPTARVLIQHPQGAVEKTIDLNQEQTVNGITVTLERIELMVDGARFSTFFIPPAYTPPPAGPGLPPAPVVTARAEYSFSGVTRNAGTAGFSTKDSGMRLVWGIGMHKLDPVPSDATELVFTITQLNDWQGPWEFRIPLE